MAKSGKRDYFGWNRLLSIILSIIPITSLIFGVATRFSEGHWICALLRIFLGWNIIWILDIIFMILTGHIFKIA